MIKHDELRKFLKQDHIRYLLEFKKFDSLYEECSVQLRPSLTEMFYNKIGINPLKYMTTIPSYFMSGSCNITDLQIPHNISNISDLCFCSCTKLQSVRFSDYCKIDILPYACFKDCVSLRQVILPSELTEIGYRTFEGCLSLAKIDLPPNLGTLNKECFMKCTSLTKINLPSTLKILYRICFIGCTNLDTITYDGTCDEFKKNVMVFNGAFVDTQIKNIKCSDGDLPLTELSIYS